MQDVIKETTTNIWVGLMWKHATSYTDAAHINNDHARRLRVMYAYNATESSTVHSIKHK